MEAALEAHRDRLLALPGVVGTAIGERRGRPCILVLVREASPRVTDAIPERIAGYPVEIDESGPIDAL